jgi:hypothetical protein
MRHALIALSGLCLISAPHLAATAQVAPDAPRAPAPRAIQCAATFELIFAAAPRWRSDPQTQRAASYWASSAQTVSSRFGMSAAEQVSMEMQAQAEETVAQPRSLSTRATQCIADAG